MSITCDRDTMTNLTNSAQNDHHDRATLSFFQFLQLLSHRIVTQYVTRDVIEHHTEEIKSTRYSTMIIMDTRAGVISYTIP